MLTFALGIKMSQSLRCDQGEILDCSSFPFLVSFTLCWKICCVASPSCDCCSVAVSRTCKVAAAAGILATTVALLVLATRKLVVVAVVLRADMLLRRSQTDLRR